MENKGMQSVCAPIIHLNSPEALLTQPSAFIVQITHFKIEKVKVL